MPRQIVLDTSALITVLHGAGRLPPLERLIRSERFILSSVVIAELYAGTRSPEDAATVQYIVESADRRGRVLTPTAHEWALVGRLLARRTRLHGAVKPRDHLADLLILVSAARLGGEVVTANLRHFEPWARLAVAAGLDVAVRPLTEE